MESKVSEFYKNYCVDLNCPYREPKEVSLYITDNEQLRLVSNFLDRQCRHEGFCCSNSYFPQEASVDIPINENVVEEKEIQKAKPSKFLTLTIVIAIITLIATIGIGRYMAIRLFLSDYLGIILAVISIISTILGLFQFKNKKSTKFLLMISMLFMALLVFNNVDMGIRYTIVPDIVGLSYDIAKEELNRREIISLLALPNDTNTMDQNAKVLWQSIKPLEIIEKKSPLIFIVSDTANSIPLYSKMPFHLYTLYIYLKKIGGEDGAIPLISLELDNVAHSGEEYQGIGTCTVFYSTKKQEDGDCNIMIHFDEYLARYFPFACEAYQQTIEEITDTLLEDWDHEKILSLLIPNNFDAPPNLKKIHIGKLSSDSEKAEDYIVFDFSSRDSIIVVLAPSLITTKDYRYVFNQIALDGTVYEWEIGVKVN